MLAADQHVYVRFAGTSGASSGSYFSAPALLKTVSLTGQNRRKKRSRLGVKLLLVVVVVVVVVWRTTLRRKKRRGIQEVPQLQLPLPPR